MKNFIQHLKTLINTILFPRVYYQRNRRYRRSLRHKIGRPTVD